MDYVISGLLSVREQRRLPKVVIPFIAHLQDDATKDSKNLSDSFVPLGLAVFTELTANLRLSRRLILESGRKVFIIRDGFLTY